MKTFTDVNDWGYVPDGMIVVNDMGERFRVAPVENSAFRELINESGGENLFVDVFDPIDHKVWASG